MAGRPKKLLAASTKHLTNEEKAVKEEEELVLSAYQPITLTVPTVLKGDRMAVAEWNRIIPLLADLPISDLDLYTVAQYCSYVSVYTKASKSVAKQGLVIEGRENPSYHIMVKASKELKTLTSELGLTINSRLRLVVPTQVAEKDDPFSDVGKM